MVMGLAWCRTSLIAPASARPMLVWIAWLVCALASSAGGQSEHVMVLLSSNAEPYRRAASACRERLREAGREARVIPLDDWSARHEESARNGVIAIGTRAGLRLSRSLSSSTRLYYCLIPDPAQAGLTSRPACAGVSAEVAIADQLALIRRAVPDARRLGVLYRSDSFRSAARVERVRDALPRGMELKAVALDAARSKVEAIRELVDSRVDLIWTMPDPEVYDAAIIKTLLLESLRHGMPVFGFSSSVVRAGSVIGVGVDPARQGERVAQLYLDAAVGAHLGARPLLAINLTVAERIGHRIPDAIHEKADQIFGDDPRGRE